MRDVSHKIFKEKRVYLKIGGSHETSVHDDVIRVLVVAEYRPAVINCVFSGYLFQLLHCLDEYIVKVFNCDLVIPSILYQVIFTVYYHFDETFVLSALLLNEVFEQLE